MKRRIISIMLASLLVMTVFSTTAMAEEEKEMSLIAGTYITNAKAVKAYNDIQSLIEAGQLDELSLMDAIRDNYFTECYYFDESGNYTHYTAEDGAVTGNYVIYDGQLFISNGIYTTNFPFTDNEDSIIIKKGKTEVTFSKILEGKALSIILNDYSNIEVEKSAVEVTEEEVEASLNSIISALTTEDGVTEGTDENGDTVSISPEINDEWAKDYALTNLGEEINTLEEFKQYIYDQLYKNKLNTAIFTEIQERATIVSYNSVDKANLVSYAADNLSYSASMYGLDAETYAMYCGYSSAYAYEEAQAKYYLDIAMIVNKALDDLGIVITQEDIDASLEKYLSNTAYAGTYSLEEFKSLSGETWVWLYENVQYKLDVMLEALEANVVFVESVEETTEE